VLAALARVRGHEAVDLGAAFGGEAELPGEVGDVQD
jgi:hypothetical protein